MSLDLGGTLLRGLAWLYPRAYARRRWADITQTYRDGVDDGRHNFTWTCSVLLDLVAQAPGAWVDSLRQPQKERFMLTPSRRLLARTSRIAVIALLVWCGSVCAFAVYFRARSAQPPWNGWWAGNLPEVHSAGHQPLINAQALLSNPGGSGTLILRGWNPDTRSYFVATFHVEEMREETGGLAVRSRVDARGALSLGIEESRDVVWTFVKGVNSNHSLLQGDVLSKLGHLVGLGEHATDAGIALFRPGTFDTGR